MTYALIIHGGAGAQPGTDYTLQKAHMGELILRGQAMLETGKAAIDVVTEMVADMEGCGLYVAGKGSAPNTQGVFELDASIMDGPERRAGAVSAIQNMVSPIKAAKLVMDDGRHVMLNGDGARAFAITKGLAPVNDAEAYYTEHEKHGSMEPVSHGTVGAVALDTQGNLAAATSTGGTFNKRPGRVGDTPIIGSGTWADEQIAISCTGEGEAFMRSCAAYDVSARVRYGDASLNAAVHRMLDQVAICGGDGGAIAIHTNGDISMPYNSLGMKRAFVTDTIPATVRVFETEPPA